MIDVKYMSIISSANKGVQGTRHKVSGPLNRDVRQ